ncbi:MAG: bifunctional riboflavin kinase/FAD synthetase [Bacteroidetes bacterium]|jgi:riboflavin kinase/FMN adenylyltransferase|nr:bifunctional riboflavin kinase/FAD synthetase [Bacteroidota bacterium]
MKRQFGLANVAHHPQSVVTVGTFDGVHAGHQQILERVKNRAAAQEAESTLLSFDPHPREVLRDAPMPLLTTVEERGELLEGVGIDRFVVLPFTERFSEMPPEAYVREILVNRIGLVEIIVGYDHSFGHKGEGDGQTLRRLGAQYGFRVEIISKQVVDRAKVSSTRIRELVGGTGEVAEARRLLTRPYRLSGTVVEGEKRGRTIGFPTANLGGIPPRKIFPARGVYAAAVTGAAAPAASVIAKQQPAMVNVGYRPTFNGTDQTVEAHLLDFTGDLYGEELQLHFLERIRDERSFDGPEALVAQLKKDRAACEAIFSKNEM